MTNNSYRLWKIRKIVVLTLPERNIRLKTLIQICFLFLGNYNTLKNQHIGKCFFSCLLTPQVLTLC